MRAFLKCINLTQLYNICILAINPTRRIMYLAILVAFLGVFSLISLGISVACAFYVYKHIYLLSMSVSPTELLTAEETKEIDDYFKDEKPVSITDKLKDIEKLNKDQSDDFEAEYMNPLKSRGL